MIETDDEYNAIISDLETKEDTLIDKIAKLTEAIRVPSDVEDTVAEAVRLVNRDVKIIDYLERASRGQDFEEEESRLAECYWRSSLASTMNACKQKKINYNDIPELIYKQKLPKR